MRKSTLLVLFSIVLFFGGGVLSSKTDRIGIMMAIAAVMICLPMAYIVRSNEKGKPKKWPYFFVVMSALFILTGFLPSESNVNQNNINTPTPEAVATLAPAMTTIEPNIIPTVEPKILPTTEPTIMPTAEQTPQPTIEPGPGETREMAYVLTVNEFVKEIMKNKEAAAKKYNGKYVELTGKITDISTVGKKLTGYYVNGKKGGSGLKITCWVSDSISLSLFTGSKATFRGIVREITTVNNTEIGECEIIKKEK